MIKMRLCLAGCFILLASGMSAQDFVDIPEGLRERALVFDITAKVLGGTKDSDAAWSASSKKVTIPGKPVFIKVEGANLVVTAQFTPYMRRNGEKVLVAQAQVWLESTGGGVQYMTNVQTIPLEFGEPVYFLPIGSSKSENDAYIEIIIDVRPYSGDLLPGGRPHGSRPRDEASDFDSIRRRAARPETDK
jgi:hypothetical protein